MPVVSIIIRVSCTGMQSSHPPLYFSQCKKAPGKIQLLLPTSFAGSMAVLSLVISHYSMTDLLIFCHNLYSILCPLLTSFMIYMNREFPNRWLSVVIVGYQWLSLVVPQKPYRSKAPPVVYLAYFPV